MGFSLFDDGSKRPAPAAQERFVRPMEAADISPVLDIIHAHDEEDGEQAKISFNEGIEGMFVALDHGKIVGVTGAYVAEDAENVAWLSWTYVHEDHQRQGIGRYLVNGLLHELDQAGIRKVFISTGDYVEDGEDIYAAAKAFYLHLGAELELQVEGYHDEDEARWIYGLDMNDPQPAPQPDDTQDLVFDGLREAEESEDGALLTWRQYDQTRDKDFDPKGKLEQLIDEARKKNARFIGAAIPSDLASGAVKGLKNREFHEVGRLKNYYAPGVDQEFWMLELDT